MPSSCGSGADPPASLDGDWGPLGLAAPALTAGSWAWHLPGNHLLVGSDLRALSLGPPKSWFPGAGTLPLGLGLLSPQKG